MIYRAAKELYMELHSYPFDFEDEILEIIFDIINQQKGEYLKKVFRDTCM